MAARAVEADAQAATGSSHAMLANRVSFVLDVHGPSEAIDTACSSSLVAVHRAMEAIRGGRCAMALAGGVNVALALESFLGPQRAGMLSPDGRCKTFADDADGYVRGEGVGAVLLKPLGAAERDGDRILGVLVGGAENHGGRAGSLTAPNARAQADLIVRALHGIDPAGIDYVEAHGTGTALGDPVEVNALKAAFARAAEPFGGRRFAPASCGLGSVKTNIGHLEAAAGIAGLIKLLLALRAGELPPSLDCPRLNPYLDFSDGPFFVLRRSRPWPASPDRPRRAGLSSFGFGGTNAHLVVEDYRPAAPSPRRDGQAMPVTVSARTPEGLRRLAAALAARVETATEPLDDIAWTLASGREPMEERLAFVAASTAESQAALLRRVYDGCGVDPAAVTLVEAHGTGTALGDPIEYRALCRVFGARRADAPPVALGSIKGNIGHGQYAAGVSGVIKVLLALRHRTIPASAHYADPNPRIDWAAGPFRVPTASAPWVAPAGERRIGAVSSFGASGTNAHVVIAEAPAPSPSAPGRPPFLVVLSARGEDALRELARRVADRCAADPGLSCADLSYSLAAGRKAFEWRLAAVADDVPAVAAALRGWLAGKADGDVLFGRVGAAQVGAEAAFDPGCDGAERRAALRGLAERFVGGDRLPLRALFQGEIRRRLPLPTTVFAEARHWLPSGPPPAAAAPAFGLPGARLRPLPDEGDRRVFALDLRADAHPLADHHVAGAPVLPGVAFLALLRDAAGVGRCRRVGDVAWARPVAPRDDAAPPPLDLAAIAAGCGEAVSADRCYAALVARGIVHGPALRALAGVRRAPGLAVAELILPEGAEPFTAILDAAIQASAALMPDDAAETAIPFAADSVEVFAPCGGPDGAAGGGGRRGGDCVDRAAPRRRPRRRGLDRDAGNPGPGAVASGPRPDGGGGGRPPPDLDPDHRTGAGGGRRRPGATGGGGTARDVRVAGQGISGLAGAGLRPGSRNALAGGGDRRTSGGRGRAGLSSPAGRLAAAGAAAPGRRRRGGVALSRRRRLCGDRRRRRGRRDVDRGAVAALPRPGGLGRAERPRRGDGGAAGRPGRPGAAPGLSAGRRRRRDGADGGARPGDAGLRADRWRGAVRPDLERPHPRPHG